MNRNTNNDDRKRRNKRMTTSNSKISTKHAEDFNTGSHSPLSLRKVDAGYDDTGLGNNSSKTDDKDVDSKQNKKDKNSQRS